MGCWAAATESMRCRATKSPPATLSGTSAPAPTKQQSRVQPSARFHRPILDYLFAWRLRRAVRTSHQPQPIARRSLAAWGTTARSAARTRGSVPPPFKDWSHAASILVGCSTVSYLRLLVLQPKFPGKVRELAASPTRLELMRLELTRSEPASLRALRHPHSSPLTASIAVTACKGFSPAGRSPSPWAVIRFSGGFVAPRPVRAGNAPQQNEPPRSAPLQAAARTSRSSLGRTNYSPAAEYPDEYR